jgi:hypothetical protein
MKTTTKLLLSELKAICKDFDLNELNEILEKQIKAKAQYTAIGIMDGISYLDKTNKAEKETKTLKAIINCVKAMQEY